MKQPLLLTSLCLLLFFFCRAQRIEHQNYWNDRELINGTYAHEIDPRQYVKVLYKKEPHFKQKEKVEMQRIVWNWNDSGFFQKFKVLDNEGILHIFFKKDSLASNTGFRGNLSLEANLKGKEGERKIEVAPYSLVGVSRREIGIESYAPTAVAQFLFNTIIEIKRTIISVEFARYDSNFVSAAIFREDSSDFQEAYNYIKENYKDRMALSIDPSEATLSWIKNIVQRDSLYQNGQLAAILANPGAFKYQQFQQELELTLKKIKKYIDYWLRRDATRYKKDIVLLHKELGLINRYLSSFQKAGADAVQAFLELASKDRINLGYLLAELQSQEEALAGVVKNIDLASNQVPLSESTLDLAYSIVRNLRAISAIEGSEIDRMINEFVPDSVVMAEARTIRTELEEFLGKEISNETYKRYFSVERGGAFNPNNFSRYARLRILEKKLYPEALSFERFKQRLSIEAGGIIYKKLVYATIDLGKSGAQPGDILFLNIVWKNIDGDRDTTEARSSLLPIGKYYLRLTGWRTEISESFYLVERINEPSLLTEPRTSPSNFKGAYGASIMRTFYYNENFRRTFAGRLINALQPSYGFNISYVDFYNDKNIEIGAGLQLGLFKNVFFLGSGINLHSIRKDEKKSAAYFMFGVSFTNIAAKFKQNAPDAAP